MAPTNPSRPLPLAEALAALVDELTACCEDSTPGTWLVTDARSGTWRHSVTVTQPGATAYYTVACMRSLGYERGDAVAIAQAHNALPRILSVLRRAAVLEGAARAWRAAWDERRAIEAEMQQGTAGNIDELQARIERIQANSRRLIAADDALRAALAGEDK